MRNISTTSQVLCQESSLKTAYTAPSVQYWNAAMLDAIEATMSGGSGGGTDVIYKTIYLLNNSKTPSTNNINTYAGHAAIMIEEHTSSSFVLYDYRAEEQATSAPGTIAGFAEGSMTFEKLQSYCQGDGVIITNGSMTWLEAYNRYIKLVVDYETVNLIRAYAQSAKVNPPWYNLLLSNCIQFVNDALRAGDVIVYSLDKQDLSRSISPNEFFIMATYASKGTLTMSQRF